MASKRAVWNVARYLRNASATGVNTKMARRSYSVAAVTFRRLRCHDDTEFPPFSSSSHGTMNLVGVPRPFVKIQTRPFSKQNRGTAKTNDTLANEQLVAAIMNRFPGASPEDVQVRTVMMDKQGKSTSDVISLRLAIQVAVENDRDLIAVSLDQEVPVVKVAALSSIEYHSRKQKSASSALPIKEFQVKAGIDEDDLLRKMEQMIGFLKKGHRTKVRIRGTRKSLTKNPQAVADTLQGVLDIVQEQGAGEPVKPPEFNEHRTQCHVLLQTPPKKK